MKLTFLFPLILRAFVLFGGCFAHKFSSPLLPFEEDDKTNVAFQDIVVAVAAPVSESYELTKLIDSLQKGRLFKEAGAMDQLSGSPDLVLDSWIYEGEKDPFKELFSRIRRGSAYNRYCGTDSTDLRTPA